MFGSEIRNQKSQKPPQTMDGRFEFGKYLFDLGSDFNVTAVFNAAIRIRQLGVNKKAQHRSWHTAKCNMP